MEELLVDAIFNCLYALTGGLFLGWAVSRFKQGHYFVFGIDIMGAILMVLNMVKIKFM